MCSYHALLDNNGGYSGRGRGGGRGRGWGGYGGKHCQLFLPYLGRRAQNPDYPMNNMKTLGIVQIW